ncbi:MAG: hypothetical protein C4298_04065 [Thermus sp.]
MQKTWTGVFLLLVFLASILFLWKPWAKAEPRIRLGLDLKGGLRIVLQADVPNPTRDDLEKARTVLENRINALGVAEPLIQVVGNNRISVNIPGIQDPETAIASIRQTGLLEFVDPGGDILVEDQTIQTDCAVPQPGGTCLTAEQAGISATPPSDRTHHQHRADHPYCADYRHCTGHAQRQGVPHGDDRRHPGGCPP